VAAAQPSTRRANQLTEDELRAIYDQGYVDEYDPHAVQRIGRLVPLFGLSGTERVADFGCGNGTLLELVSDRVAQYHGVDFSDAFVHEARRRQAARGFRHATYHCGDIVAFCADHPEQFDVAFAIDFIEHIYDDQLLRIGAAIRGALKPGGVCYVHTPNGEYFMERFRRWGILHQIEGHVGVRDAAQYERLLADCGFSEVRVQYLSHYLRVAGTLHGLGALPIIGRHFRARLFLTCRK
jgi:2-polyprenyl-3-methyl-5-hydroxy-6-metoxy-1,4-benzoquinol methylase